MREDANNEDFDMVFKSISKTTLGTIVEKLYKIDHTYMQPYFGEKDYAILREITQIRNYWAHQGYVDWVYTNAKTSFSNAWGHLINDYKNSFASAKENTSFSSISLKQVLPPPVPIFVLQTGFTIIHS